MNREEELLKLAKNSSSRDTALTPQIILGHLRYQPAPLLQ